MIGFFILLSGEIQRMQKYAVIAATLVVAILWVLALYLSGFEEVATIFPMLIFIDAVAMSILIVGVTLFFEKGEGSLRSILVSPVSEGQYTAAKICAGVFLHVATLAILYTYAHLVLGFEQSFFALLMAVVLVSVFHSFVGFLFTYRVRDFTTLLISCMAYVFVFLMPVIFDYMGLVQHAFWETLLYLLPTRASLLLITAPAGGVQSWELWYSVVYLILGSAFLCRVILKNFNDFATKESGV